MDTLHLPTFDSLFQSIGADKTFLTELVDTFLQDAPRQFAALHAARAAGDADTFRRAAHSLKSNASSFGAAPLTEQCRALEELGKSGDIAHSGGQVAAAEAEFDQVRAALETALNALHPPP
jgi:HPt (histidine-containing phosphotransfer) domain-containing protein